MRILNVIGALDMGGAETLLVNSAPLFKENYNHDVDVLLFKDGNQDLSNKLRAKNVKVYSLDSSSVCSLSTIYKLTKFIKNNNYDIIHTHLFPAQWWVIFSKFLSRSEAKFVTTEHSTYNRRREYPALRPIDKLTYAKFDSIISISEDTENALIDWLKPSKKNLSKYKVIPNGVPLENYKNALPYHKEEIHNSIKKTQN